MTLLALKITCKFSLSYTAMGRHFCKLLIWHADQNKTLNINLLGVFKFKTVMYQGETLTTRQDYIDKGVTHEHKTPEPSLYKIEETDKGLVIWRLTLVNQWDLSILNNKSQTWIKNFIETELKPFNK